MLTFYIRFIVPSTVVLPLLVGFTKFRLFSRADRIILIYLLLSGLTNLIIILLAIKHINNLSILQWYTVLELALIASFFYEKFAHNTTIRLILLLTTIAFIIFCIVFPLIVKSSGFDTYATSIEALLVNVMCITLLGHNNQENLSGRWHQNPANWYAAGLLLYFSGSMFLFLLSNYLMTAQQAVIIGAWTMHATLLLLMYISFTIGFIKCNRLQTT